MPDWIVWMIVGFVVLSVVRRRGGCAWDWSSREIAGRRERDGRALGGGDAGSLGRGPGGRLSSGGHPGIASGGGRHAGGRVAAGTRPRGPTGNGRHGARPEGRRTLAPESPVERLKRQFVEGTLSMEEYERALDELDPRQL